MLSYWSCIALIVSVTIIIYIVVVLMLLLFLPEHLFEKIVKKSETFANKDKFVKERKHGKRIQRCIEIGSVKPTDNWIQIFLRPRWRRIPKGLQLSPIMLVAVLAFIDGCIFPTNILTSGQLCLEDTRNCYVLERWHTLSVRKSFRCTVGEPVITESSDDLEAICWGYVLDVQKAGDILNQLGVCTSIIGLSFLVYCFFLCMAYRPWGLFVLIPMLLAEIGGLLTLILKFPHRDPLTYVLLSLAIILTIIPIIVNIVYLVGACVGGSHAFIDKKDPNKLNVPPRLNPIRPQKYRRGLPIRPRYLHGSGIRATLHDITKYNRS